MGTHGGELAWFVSRGGQQHGPMSQLALATIACERRLDASDLIWCTGLADWVAAGDVPGLITAQATAVSRTPPKLPAGRSVREVGAVSPMETLRPTVAARRAGSDPALQREQRTPIESFAPQPRRTLLSEALARARPASTSSVPHVSDTPATPAVAVEADDRLGRVARSLSAWTSGLSSGMAAGLNRAVAVSGERVLALKASLPDIDAGALRRAFDATMKDPAFLAEAEKSKLEIDPMTGEELAAFVSRLAATPADAVKRVKDALAGK